MERKKEFKGQRICYIKDHVCHIPLADGREAICDEDRFEEVKDYSIHIHNHGYAQFYLFNGKRGAKKVLLHRFLYPEFKYIDHINNNKLDNRSCNLRECTVSQNGGNMKLKTCNSSGYKGVGWHKASGKWRARLGIKSQEQYLGIFDDIKDAARAYNKAAVEYFGEFAKLNVIED